ncbi:nucleotide sugar dehydrogenase [Candidatus Saccharibacteria bacterium]|nr:nucleotide sugar dehydrogenase [Candidatus Saccharibacteria bacterium]
MSKNNNVSVIGLGYVGLPLALLAAEKGYSVTGIDTNKQRVSAINAGKDPIGDSYVANKIKENPFTATTNYESIAGSKVVLICVPTPVKDVYKPDLSYLKSAVESVAEKMTKDTLIVVESTINPGVCDEVVVPLLESKSDLKINKDFFLSHCPERINPGDPKWSVDNIPRVVGASSHDGLMKAVDFYESIIEAPVKPMSSLKEAEAVKIVENSFRDINIAFVNELAMSFTKLGIDVKNVIDGAATKPFAFMPHYPSIGVGGHCIPVDPYYLIEYARGHGFDHEFLSLARSINSKMPDFTIDRLTEALSEVGLSLKGAKIAVLGLSYKANVADDRESPSYKLIKILGSKDVKVATYDPYFPESSTTPNLQEAIKDVDAIVLATNHDQFKNLPNEKTNAKVFIDGKNAFEKEDFSKRDIVYRGIGRGYL